MLKSQTFLLAMCCMKPETHLLFLCTALISRFYVSEDFFFRVLIKNMRYKKQ